MFDLLDWENELEEMVERDMLIEELERIEREELGEVLEEN